MSGIAEELKKVDPAKIVTKESRKNPVANKSLAYELALAAIEAAEKDSSLSLNLKENRNIVENTKGGEEANGKYLITKLANIKDNVETKENFVKLIGNSLNNLYQLTNSEDSMPDRKNTEQRAVATNSINVAERIIKGYAKGAIDNVEGLKQIFNDSNVHVTRELLGFNHDF